MRKQAINEQRQRKQRENTLIDYKDNEKQQGNSMGNSNEIRPLPTRNEGVASGEGDPNKLSNNFSKNEVLKRQKQLKKDLEADWIRNSPLYNNFWDFGSGVIEFKDAENCQKMMKLLSEGNVEIGDIKQKEYDPKLYNKKIHFVIGVDFATGEDHSTIGKDNKLYKNPLSEGMEWEVGERRSEMMVEKKIHKC